MIFVIFNKTFMLYISAFKHLVPYQRRSGVKCKVICDNCPAFRRPVPVTSSPLPISVICLAPPCDCNSTTKKDKSPPDPQFCPRDHRAPTPLLASNLRVMIASSSSLIFYLFATLHVFIIPRSQVHNTYCRM